MQSRADWIGKPVTWLRSLTWVICSVIVGLAIAPLIILAFSDKGFELHNENWFTEILQIMETATNNVVLVGAAVFFLLTVETRYKRQRALKALHELRSIAHVIDMHQLTKDPHRIMSGAAYQRTGGSPKLEMTQFMLRRYLDYCSEMLSLTGKIAAVYAQEFDDGVAMAGAAELETLTTGLSRKIWQKIAMLHTIEADRDDAIGSVPVVGGSNRLEKSKGNDSDEENRAGGQDSV
ncbi:MAG: hypothetical protein AB8B55_11935 [Mariniblastus sp.]